MGELSWPSEVMTAFIGVHHPVRGLVIGLGSSMWDSDGELRFWTPFLALSEWLISDERRWTFGFRLVVCCVPGFFPWYLNGSPVSAGAPRGHCM